jgi:hypothetical protein
MPPNFNNTRDILAHYHLQYRLEEFMDFKQTSPLMVTDYFSEEIRFGLTRRGDADKEAFTSEFIIVPCLRTTWQKHPRLNLFSHVPIQAEDFTVIPDYLVTSPDPTGYKTVQKPLLLTVEAKNEKFEEGWTQALLQAVVCQKINGTADIPVLAIVTTGDFWQFGKLEKQIFTKHPVPASVQHVEELLGILDMLFAECEKML